MKTKGRCGLSISGNKCLSYAYWCFCFVQYDRTLGIDPGLRTS